MSEVRRKPRTPLTLDSVEARVDNVVATATRLGKIVLVGVISVAAIGGSIVYAVQEQVASLKEKGRQLQQEVVITKDTAIKTQQKAETNEDRIARLNAELAATKAENDSQDSQIRDASTTADAAADKADKKQPPKVIDRTVTKQVPVTPTPTPKPQGPLGLPPLFPRSER